MRFRVIHALVAALSAFVMLLGFAAVSTATPSNGNGSGNANANGQANAKANAKSNANANSNTTTSTTTNTKANDQSSGQGSAGRVCGTNHSSTGTGANHTGGPYDANCQTPNAPSMNGNGGGQATGKPCAGCVGNADYKNPKGQMPNGSDHNAGYECDRNNGIGKTNPAHTGCVQSSVTPPCVKGDPNCPETSCPKGDPKCPETNCPKGDPKCPETSCPKGDPKCTETTTCPAGDAKCPKTPTPTQAVLGEQVGSAPREQTPANQEVLGENAAGTTPSSGNSPATTAPASAQQAQPASAKKGSLPFTGTDGLAVLLAGALLLMAGFGLRRLATHRA